MMTSVPPFAWRGSDELASVASLDRERVTQCALSRVCGFCGRPLGRPIAFVGTPQEAGRNAFQAPPLHVECVSAVCAMPGADPSWEVVRTAGFEYVRPGGEGQEQHPTFQPNSVI